MNLVSEVKLALASYPPFDAGERRIEVAEGGDRIACQLTALDSLACGFLQLRLESAALAGASLDRLKLVGDGLARRLTYLLEPIAILEVDPSGAAVQLRSTPPARELDSIRYYELLVERQGALALCRFCKIPGEARNRVAAHVTREVFCRLVGDFAAAVA